MACAHSSVTFTASGLRISTHIPFANARVVGSHSSSTQTFTIVVTDCQGQGSHTQHTDTSFQTGSEILTILTITDTVACGAKKPHRISVGVDDAGGGGLFSIK